MHALLLLNLATIWIVPGQVSSGRYAPRTMTAHDRYLYLVFHIDANRINARGKLEHVNRLEKWRADGLIDVMMSRTAQAEAATGSETRMTKAYGYIFTMTSDLTQTEGKRRSEISRILFPHGLQSRNEQNDVDIVFNADKYRAILVTNDGASKSQPAGILGRRDELTNIGIRVVSDREAVEMVLNAIASRDDRIRRICNANNESPPIWVGSD